MKAIVLKVTTRAAGIIQGARLTTSPAGYAKWVTELNGHLHSAPQRAALVVNRKLVLLYWQIGRDILTRQADMPAFAEA